MTNAKEVLTLTTDIVSAYLRGNTLGADQIPGLIQSVRLALADPGGAAAQAQEPLKPAVSVRKSVTDDYVVCLEDGAKLKSLKRHLNTRHSLTPDAYREKWALSRDYPMVAPAYAKSRSELAKNAGLGRKRLGDTRAARSR